MVVNGPMLPSLGCDVFPGIGRRGRNGTAHAATSKNRAGDEPE